MKFAMSVVLKYFGTQAQQSPICSFICVLGLSLTSASSCLGFVSASVSSQNRLLFSVIYSSSLCLQSLKLTFSKAIVFSSSSGGAFLLISLLISWLYTHLALQFFVFVTSFSTVVLSELILSRYCTF